MSERRCEECTSRYSLRTYAPCSRCDGFEGHPEWMPNEQHALRIRAEQAEARAADAYAALEMIYYTGVNLGTYSCPPAQEPVRLISFIDVDAPQSLSGFFQALSAATGRTLEPPREGEQG